MVGPREKAACLQFNRPEDEGSRDVRLARGLHPPGTCPPTNMLTLLCFVLQIAPQQEARTLRGSAGWLWDKFRRLPINKPSLIKVLLVLAYAQMIIQQMENRHNLATHTSLLAGAASQAALDSAPPTGPCCARQPDDGQDLINADQGSASGGAGLADWFSCMWTSARACSANTAQQQQRARTSGARLLELTTGLLGQLFGFVLSALVYLYERLANVHALIYSAWLARWRSPIIQRLIQSILVHVCYINSLMFAREHAPVD